jgi:hypothetical protein
MAEPTKNSPKSKTRLYVWLALLVVAIVVLLFVL